MARAMVTRYGMSETFDMMALETMDNPYLSDDASLIVSEETATKVDAEVLEIIKTCHQKAIKILKENIEKLHEITKYLYENETLSGEEFMEMLHKEGDQTFVKKIKKIKHSQLKKKNFRACFSK